MTEEFPSDTPSPNPAPDSSDDVAGETEVDALLAEAAELAAEVSQELEEIQPEKDSSAPQQLSPADNLLIPEAGDVDAQLAALDALIDEASQEIGKQEDASNAEAEDSAAQASPAEPVAPPSPTADQATSPTVDLEDSSAQIKAPETEVDMQDAMDAIPDFMQDLTGPSEDEPASASPIADAAAPATSENSPPSPVAANVDASKDLSGTVEQELLATGRTRSLSPTSTPAAQPEQTQVAELPKKKLRIPSLKIPPKVSAAAVSICDRAVNVLEVIDRPAERIGDRPRVVMGLVAIATFGTAVVVFIVSLF